MVSIEPFPSNHSGEGETNAHCPGANASQSTFLTFKMKALDLKSQILLSEVFTKVDQVFFG
jgi:hypothetical protein